MRHSRLTLWLLGGFTLLVYAYKILPVFVVVALAFNPPEFGSFPIVGFTTRWFGGLLDNPAVVTAVKTSLRLAVATAAIATVLGVAAAYALVRYPFRGRAAVQLLLTMPILVPHLIVGVGLLLAFRILGLSRSFTLMLLGHVALTMPFVILTTQHRLQAIPLYLEEASRTLGANGWQTFREVTLPLAAPAIVTGFVFAFMSSFDEVTATLFWRPANFDTVPIYVLSELQNSVSQELNALAAALVGFSVGVPVLTMLLLHLWTSRRRRPARAPEATPAWQPATEGDAR
ncbi:ABC transporter permease [Rhodovarius crocodyli]|uniref:ABC transporter permease n=1 Tax=Rhodovarius crocodyli TaxID=1979269 RepID=A0A437MM22_9PROT|nr:ABC transporter permease [Rhodovarius crocodyli]RVT98656.1 ABC transporter permease [Rhodovarius crocodyli]